MTETPLIIVKREVAGITELSLNRPEKRNALNMALMAELCAAIEEASKNPAQRVLILRGEGPIFCAGLDLNEAQKLETAEPSGEWVAKTLKALYGSPLVTIAAVHGAALAGGAGLMAACDFVVATEDTRFGFPETRRGLVAAQVMVLLTRQLRQRDLRELVLFGEFIDATRALSIGLINRVVAMEALIDEAYRHAQSALQGAPQATVLAKKVLDELYPHDINIGIKYHHEMRQSPEAKEGMSAFLDKRPPNWERRES